MSYRAVNFFAPSSPWPWSLGRSLSRVGRSATTGSAGTRFGVPDFGRTPWHGRPARRGLGAMLRAAWRRHRTRRCLTDLDAHALKDIGVSYAEAEAEANKPFWMV